MNYAIGLSTINTFGLVGVFELDEPPLRGRDDGLGAIDYRELAEDVLNMDFHRVLGNGQDRPDLLISKTFVDQFQDFQLAWAQSHTRRMFGQPRSYRLSYVPLAGVDVADGLH